MRSHIQEKLEIFVNTDFTVLSESGKTCQDIMSQNLLLFFITFSPLLDIFQVIIIILNIENIIDTLIATFFRLYFQIKSIVLALLLAAVVKQQDHTVILSPSGKAAVENTVFSNSFHRVVSSLRRRTAVVSLGCGEGNHQMTSNTCTPTPCVRGKRPMHQSTLTLCDQTKSIYSTTHAEVRLNIP